MSRAVVHLTVAIECNVTDGGYLRNASIEDHLQAAAQEVQRWIFLVQKAPRLDPERVKHQATVTHVVIEP